MICASADFETTTDPNDCRVWAWGVCNILNPDEFVTGNDIISFFQFLAKSDVKTVWFHNLAFDGKFIIDALLRVGYEYTPERMPEFMKFSELISKSGKFYQIKINLGGKIVTILDSLKLFPMSVKKLAKTFGAPEQKGEIDYNEFRPIGHDLTDTELDYLRRDIQIPAYALALNQEQGLTKMTIGANAFEWFKQHLGKSRFRKLFPAIERETDTFIRQAYRGGYTYCNPKYADVDIQGGISVDYNSMYPSMMISKPYPVGKPIRFDGRYKPDNVCPLYVQRLTCMFELKPNCLPCIQIKGSWGFGEHEYVESAPTPVTITLTCVDLKLFMDMYDVDVCSWDGGFKFGQMEGLFTSYVDHWGGVKKASKGGKRQLAKLMLNNLYGKFATNPDVTRKHPVLENDDVVHYVVGEQEFREPVYIPVGAFVTAYARDTLIRAIMANRDRFIYCDTDSMHLIGTEDPDGIRIHDVDLCAWKVEGTFTHARHLRAKCYIWDLNGKLSVTCAGMPDNVKAFCTFDNFHYGFRNFIKDSAGNKVFKTFSTIDENGESVTHDAGRLIPVCVPGGVVLEKRVYELAEK